VKSILIIHQGAIGDFILSLPPLEAIHRFYSQTRFIFLGNPSILEIIHSRPYFDFVLNCAEKRWAPLYNSKGKLETGVFASLPPVDSIFAFCRSSSQTLVDNLARIYEKPSYRIDPFPEPDLGLHVSDYQCRQLEELGIPSLPCPAPVIAPSQEDFLKARRFIQENVTAGNQLVLLHPGSGGRKKLWSVTGWLDVIMRISSNNKIKISLIEGPADSHIVQQLCSEVGSTSLLLANNWRLGKLAALMKHSSLYLGNDSGITHLAAACNTPTIALFGPTDPRIWGPQGAKVTVVPWHSKSPAHDSKGELEKTSKPPRETGLVLELARSYLEI
jgi:ADP-heptose:LPS heptosyltransferase